MHPSIVLVLDVTVLLALAVTMFYSFKLSKQISAMQADRRAFEDLIKALNLASARAEGAVKNIKENATACIDDLQEKINKARGMTSELEIIIQAGDSLANRLEQLATGTRKTDNVTAAPIYDENDAPKSRAEKELLAALKAKQK